MNIKRLTLCCILFTPFAYAQQNLFNVPSSDITEKDKVFIQQQINFTRSGVANLTLDYGIGNDIEIGINIFNTTFYSANHDPVNPFLLVNFQKGFEITDHWKIGVGSQFGANPIFHGENTTQFLDFSYINNALDLESWGKYYLGSYYVNKGYGGKNNNFGFMAGVDIPIIEDRLNFVADFISGSNNLSVAVVGGVYKVNKNWQISLGAQLPSPQSNNEYGLVFELTKL